MGSYRNVLKVKLKKFQTLRPVVFGSFSTDAILICLATKIHAKNLL